MARLSFVDPETAPEPIREALSQLPPLNIFKMMAHAETCMRPALSLGGAILSKQELGARERELLILHAAKLEGGEYEWIQHVPIALAAGASQAQIDALDAGDLTADCYDERDRALLAFSKQVIENVRVDDAIFAAAKSHFSEREIVESILTIGFYMMMARLTEATETDLDEAAGNVVIDNLKAET